MSATKTPDNLIIAAEREPAPVERRKQATRRAKGERRKNVTLSLGLDISPAGVSLAIIRETSGNDQKKLITEYVPFDPTSGPYRGDWSTDELADVLVALSEKYRLNGQAIHVALGGEPCVTRSWFGDNEKVDANIEELTERTNRYLALGRGEKVCCYAEQQINAKRKRAWVTVAHREVVDAVARAAEKAGLRLTRMEHALSTLCEVIGFTGRDAEQPVLLLTKGAGRPELGISYRGQLILDYRAAQTVVDASQGEDLGVRAVQKHLKCVRRFAQSQLPRGQNELREIVLPGRKQLSQAVSLNLAEHELAPHCIPLCALCEGLTVDNEPVEMAEMLAAVWLARAAMRRDPALAADLTQSLHSRTKVTWAVAAKALWPLAASLLLVMGLHWAVSKEKAVVLEAEAKLEALQPARLEAQQLRMQLAASQQTVEHIEALHASIQPVNWNDIIKYAGRALPHGAWLKSLKIERESQVLISGASFSDDAIYDYVSRLRQSQLFQHVTLGGTKSVRLQNGPAFEFEISTTAISAADDNPHVARASAASLTLTTK